MQIVHNELGDHMTPWLARSDQQPPWPMSSNDAGKWGVTSRRGAGFWVARNGPILDLERSLGDHRHLWAPAGGRLAYCCCVLPHLAT
jgi:hypothetical protein